MAAVQATADEISPADPEQAQWTAAQISTAFGRRKPVPLPPGRPTVLEALRAGIAGQLSGLDDAGRTAASMPGAPVSEVAYKLTGHLVREIVIRGSQEGPLTPLADQLNHDLTHLQGERIEGMLARLSDRLGDALGPSVSPAGSVGRRPRADVGDPFALEVHRPVQPDVSQPALPVPRGHPDQRGTSTADAAAAIQDEQRSLCPPAPVIRKPHWTGSARPLRVLESAERVAQSILDRSSRASALVPIVKVLADADPGRAAQVMADALKDISPDSSTFAEILAVMATSDPDQAEHLAQSIPRRGTEAFSLGHIAAAMAAAEPDRAERVARLAEYDSADVRALKRIVEVIAVTDPDRAERIAGAIPDEWSQAETLETLAARLAVVDPVRAGRIAESISKMDLKVSALAEIACRVTDSAPDLAARLITSAECACESMNDKWPALLSQKQRKAIAYAEIACALVELDPAREARFVADAERVARSIIGKARRVEVLVDVAETLANFDPAQSVRLLTDAACLAQSIRDWWRINRTGPRGVGGIVPSTRDSAIAQVAIVAASVDPDLAERVARSIMGVTTVYDWSGAIVTALAAAAPDRAEGVARLTLTSYSGDDAQGAAVGLGEVARVVAASDPDRAERIARSIVSPHHDFSYERDIALKKVAQVTAAFDLDRAERIAWSIVDKEIKVKTLAAIARVMLQVRGDR